MILNSRIKIGMLVMGNAVLLYSTGYLIFKMFYKNYLKYKKESKRLLIGEQSNFEYLDNTFKQEGKEIGQIYSLSFIGKSEPAFQWLDHKYWNQLNENTNEKYIVVKEVWYEENNSNGKINTQYIRTPWINVFKLTDENNQQITIHVNNKENFMPSLFQSISGQELLFANDIFCVKMKQEGIAFGSNLYVFGNVTKIKPQDYELEPEFICNSIDAISEIYLRSKKYLIEAACLVTCCLLISGFSIHLTFSN